MLRYRTDNSEGLRVYSDTAVRSIAQTIQGLARGLPARQLKGVVLDKTFTDKGSGKDAKRPQLETVQGFVRKGDTVFCHSMDRLTRNLDGLWRIVLGLTKRGVRIVFVKGSLIFTGEDSRWP